MSRGAEVRLPFAGEERLFRLGIGELRQLQEACGNDGPEVIAHRLRDPGPPRRWLVDDVRAPILLGLIGGGMLPAAATRLVVKWLDAKADYVGNLPVAWAVIIAAITGPRDEPLEPPKEDDADPPEGKEPAKAPAGSPSPSST